MARLFRLVQAESGWFAPVETFLAVLFHDAVYVPGAADNEARSAELASAAIRRFLPDAPTDLDRVSRLILLTAGHGHLAPEDVDRDAALFLDCDMAILGASPAVFDAYHAGIAPRFSQRFCGTTPQTALISPIPCTAHTAISATFSKS